VRRPHRKRRVTPSRADEASAQRTTQHSVLSHTFTCRTGWHTSPTRALPTALDTGWSYRIVWPSPEVPSARSAERRAAASAGPRAQAAWPPTTVCAVEYFSYNIKPSKVLPST
jgi:hypothetical protein